MTLNADYEATPTLPFQGAAYFRGFRQSVVNGNTTDYTACTPAADSGALPGRMA